MALFYSDKAHKPRATALELTIDTLDAHGLGVGRANNKTWFVENALPHERVQARITQEKRHFGHARAVNITQPSNERITPKCGFYHRCGGCQLQHMPESLQRNLKQTALFDRLQALQSAPIQGQAIQHGNAWQYRRRAHLSLNVNRKTNTLAMGFRAKGSNQIVPINHCEVLTPALNALLAPLQALFSAWQHKTRLGHIELTEAANGIALLLRHVGEIGEKDKVRLLEFAKYHHLLLFVSVQENYIQQWHGEAPYYQLANGQKLYFAIRDFIQVNAEMNQALIDTALDWLHLTRADTVLDLFCGIGNFTLPLAQHCQSAVGVEGVKAMVERATFNAKCNKCDNIAFYQADLAQDFSAQPWAQNHFTKVLLDPPRAGAAFVIPHLCKLKPREIVYVSCHSATLARDSEMLIAAGFEMTQCVAVDMFPQTGHVEAMAHFRQRAGSRR
ncbi:23S rRNA (uracil(1939)-C(5))-methyltransferase RlmD [Pasteurellaceae bacterium HPA106]|uniref:23S rRNA (uracil(1939)-C(5))-methyltransferase RlmD n=1 Tax=Spirabiliibacterium pneumoniae TaxID=221400 RepID=UPI001AAC59D5|nr:23S rRNA (uracil(1939)-C(5))-methyltransferase RlmD [Spirabiliibacterium pneumoniae]MBE2896860.1 23S rRNA (uracil(1939)-C(5))-methyltransferase RlmD [Spirabiliibacterium pneumoniae]